MFWFMENSKLLYEGVFCSKYLHFPLFSPALFFFLEENHHWMISRLLKIVNSIFII